MAPASANASRAFLLENPIWRTGVATDPARARFHLYLRHSLQDFGLRMRNAQQLAPPCSTAAIISVALLLVATIAPAQDDPFAGGGSHRPKRINGLINQFGPTAYVYEVSKAGTDKKKLFQVFAAVRSATGGTLTQDEFLRRLKSREHFEIHFPEKCRTCKGWGRVVPARGNRDKDGKIRCPRCRSSGSEMRPYIVKWSAQMLTHQGDQRDPILAGLRRELGEKASALVWFSTARRYHTGELRHRVNARAHAHAAYQEAVALANAAWREDEPADSELNRVYRQIIDDGLEGIADTAAKRGEKESAPSPSTEKPATH